MAAASNETPDEQPTPIFSSQLELNLIYRVVLAQTDEAEASAKASPKAKDGLAKTATSAMTEENILH
ncbi:hypothetical protein ACLX1H_007936 [Fusarium chlamydosporum]